MVITILNLKSLYSSVSNETANEVILKLLNSDVPDNCEVRILTASLILSIILFCSLPKILKDAGINIIDPSKTSKIDEKLFSIWYKYRCFERKCENFIYNLQPRRLYEILAKKYEDKELIDGKPIEISDEIITKMGKEGLFRKKDLNP
jgi:hypothetical protein